jgi:hypothetical protein
VAVGVLCLLVGGLAAIVLRVGDRSPGNGPQHVAVVSPQSVLRVRPYMAVACRRPNSIACDRVGLAVWTRRPANSVRATVAGRGFTLPYQFCCFPQPRAPHIRRQFVGFLHHAGLRGPGPLAVRVENGRNRWTGVHPVSAEVQLLITFPDGSQATTRTRAPLLAGWG